MIARKTMTGKKPTQGEKTEIQRQQTAILEPPDNLAVERQTP
jgi:hypothetical protein